VAKGVEKYILKLTCSSLCYNKSWDSGFVVCKHQTYCIVLPANGSAKYQEITVFSLNSICKRKFKQDARSQHFEVLLSKKVYFHTIPHLVYWYG